MIVICAAGVQAAARAFAGRTEPGTTTSWTRVAFAAAGMRRVTAARRPAIADGDRDEQPPCGVHAPAFADCAEAERERDEDRPRRGADTGGDAGPHVGRDCVVEQAREVDADHDRHDGRDDLGDVITTVWLLTSNVAVLPRRSAENPARVTGALEVAPARPARRRNRGTP